MHLIYWGTYDLDRPRNRIHFHGLRAQGIDVIECHIDAWRGSADKSRVRGIFGWTRMAIRLARAYVVLIYRYLRQPPHDLVVVGYLGLIDLFVIWPWAKLRGKPVVWDALMSLYTTLVVDRRVFSPRSVGARALFVAERLACRLADRVLVTTATRRADFTGRYELAANKVVDLPVGAEFDLFPARPLLPVDCQPRDGIRILFYGNFTPLHGVPIIIRAAQLVAARPYHWTLIGNGQAADQVRQLLDEGPKLDLEWIERVDYRELHRWIHAADIGLGFFGGSPKAAETIPNKVYQLLATGTPLITRSSPTMAELIPPEGAPGIYLVPPEDPQAIVDALDTFAADRVRLSHTRLHGALNQRVADSIDGARLKSVLESTLARAFTQG